MPVRSWRYIVRFKRGKKKKEDTFHCFFLFQIFFFFKSLRQRVAVWEELTRSHSSPSQAATARRRRRFLHSLMCSFVKKKRKKTGRGLVNFNFWFQKLSNTAQMRNQFSQLPWLCGEANSCHWWAACHMTKSGISPAGPCCRHLNYRLPLVIYLHNISFSKHNSYLIHDSLHHSNCNIDWCGKIWSNFTCNFFFFALRANAAILLICCKLSQRKIKVRMCNCTLI